MKFSTIELTLLYWFYPLLFIVCTFQAMNIISPGLPGEGVYVWPFRLFILYVGFKAFRNNTLTCRPFIIYLIYTYASIILYFVNGYPLSLYFIEFAFSSTTFSFFFLGMNTQISHIKFYKISIWAIVIMFIVGLYLYILPPAWYQEAWVRRMSTKWYLEGMNVGFEHVSENMRFSSIWLTSYATEFFGIFALPFCLLYMSTAKTKKKRYLYSIFVIIILLCVILSMQRAAILGCSLVFLFYLLYDGLHKQKGIIFCFAMLAFIIYIYQAYGDTELGARVSERFMSINVDDAFGGTRAEQNENAFHAIQNIILGSGLGTCGTMARRLGFPAVTDSNYMKILFEQGIVGSILFLILIINSLLKFKKNFKYLFAEGAIVCCYLLAMLGSNALSFSWFSPLFWFALGRLWNNNYVDYLKSNKLGI